MKDAHKSEFETRDIAKHITEWVRSALSIEGKPVSPKVVRSQTPTGSEVIVLDLGGRDRFHITITRARR